MVDFRLGEPEAKLKRDPFDDVIIIGIMVGGWGRASFSVKVSNSG